MNELIKMQLFIRDLLSYNESLILRGREGHNLNLFNDNYIVVDGIGPSVPLAKKDEYDGTLEMMTYSALYQRPLTIDFYGDNAYDNAKNFSLLVRSQQAYELQTANQITVKNIGTVTDVKALVGSIYGNMIQIELNIMFTESVDVETLRIDEAQIQIKVD